MATLATFVANDMRTGTCAAMFGGSTRALSKVSQCCCHGQRTTITALGAIRVTGMPGDPTRRIRSRHR